MRRPSGIPVRERRPAWDEWNLGLTNVKKQHFNPKMVLRNFALPGTEQITAFKLDTNTGLRLPLTEAAAEGRFYDIEITAADIVAAAGDPDLTVEDVEQEFAGRRVSTETWFSTLEDAAAPVIRDLIEDPDTIMSLTFEQENTLARFCASLWLRGPWMRDQMEDLRTHLIDTAMRMLRSHIYNSVDRDEADRLWEYWSNQPPEEVIEGLGPDRPRWDIARIMAGVQGYANLLMAMGWRIGLVSGDYELFTADNAVARYLTPNRPIWNPGGFDDFDWLVPLSPRVLLKVERGLATQPDPDGVYRGWRRRLDFTAWETSVARHLVAHGAKRFLYGQATPVTRGCATRCLDQIQVVKVQDAIVKPRLKPYLEILARAELLDPRLIAAVRSSLRALPAELMGEFRRRNL